MARMANTMLVRIVAIAAGEHALPIEQVRIHAKGIAAKAMSAGRSVAYTATGRMAWIADANRIGRIVVRARRHAASIGHEQRKHATTACARAIVRMARDAVGRAILLLTAGAVAARARRGRRVTSVAPTSTLIARATGTADNIRAQIVSIHVDINPERAGDDARHAHAIGRDAEERREVAHKVVAIEEVFSRHLDAEREHDSVDGLDLDARDATAKQHVNLVLPRRVHIRAARIGDLRFARREVVKVVGEHPVLQRQDLGAVVVHLQL